MKVAGPASALALLAAAAAAEGTAAGPPGRACPSMAALEAEGAVIRDVTIRPLPIFDDEPGLPAIYRWADRLHVDTRDSAIESRLLFAPGERIRERRIDETLRNLRDLRYIREPAVRASDCRDGAVSLEVSAREVWTTNPGLSFSRSGGANSGGLELEELNLLGLGKQLSLALETDPDRSSFTAHWRDPNVAGTHWVNDFAWRESDDGRAWSLRVERPFFSLDARWSTGLALLADRSVEPVYRAGERVAAYASDVEYAELRFGRSAGLASGWAHRTIFGYRREHARFSAAPEDVQPDLMPADRLLDYPFLRFEGVQDDFDTVRNRDQIARTEDRAFGLSYALELGWSSPSLGADRDALLLHANAARGWRLRADDSLFADAALTSRVEGGRFVDSQLSASLRYYRPTGPRGVFYVGLTGAAAHEPDVDHELSIGGDTGLRGYPLRYQAGSATALLTVEQRYFTRYSLWKLADVGAAVFVDVGRAFGEPTFGPSPDYGLLKDVGFGLRLGSTRSALGNVLHVDVAFPLDGPRTLDSVQFLVQTKRSF